MDQTGARKVQERRCLDRRKKKRNMESQKRETGREKKSERRDLARKQAPGINALQTKGHWGVIDLAVDSGGHRDRGRHRVTAECPDLGW